MNGIIYKGKVVVPDEVDIDVVDAMEAYGSHYWWDPSADPRNCRPRFEPITAGIIHHQAGEGDADNVFRVLEKRPKKAGGFNYLSVHFEIDQKGTITQLADLDTVCKHAGDANDWTWGVEIANLGMGKPSKEWPRDRYMDEMHGHKTWFLAFYDEQKKATVRLVKAVHSILGLGFRIPCGGDPKRPIRAELADEKLDDYQVLAHHHLTIQKPDPAPDMMDYLAEHLPGAMD